MVSAHLRNEGQFRAGRPCFFVFAIVDSCHTYDNVWSSWLFHDNGIPILRPAARQLPPNRPWASQAERTAPPTMRKVAMCCAIDLNTVQRAYAELERDGLLTLVRGRGNLCRRGAALPVPTSPITEALAAKVAAQAKALGIAPRRSDPGTQRP